MLIPQPRQLQPLTTANAGAIAQGLNQGMSLANQYQQNQLGKQTQQLSQMKLDQAQQSMTREQAQDALSSIAQGAETVMTLPTDDQRYSFLANRRDQLAAQGRNTEQTDDALRIGMNEGFTSPAFNQAMAEGLQTANSMGVYTEQQKLQRAAQAQMQAQEASELGQIRKEVRGTLTSDIKDIKKNATVLTQNWDKLNNLTGEIQKGNRQAVAPALVSLVKLGDPSSVVSITEMKGVLNEQNPIAALLGLGVNSDVVKSLEQKLDLLNPENINVDDLLSAGRAQLGGNIPALKQGYEEAKARASDNLSVSGQKSLFSKKLDSIVGGLVGLMPEQEAAPVAEVDTTGWVQMQDANGNRALVGPNGEIKEL